MAKLTKEFREQLNELNDSLFRAEHKMRNYEAALSAARHFLAAEPDEDSRVIDLVGALKNYERAKMRVEEQRYRFRLLLNNYHHHYQE